MASDKRKCGENGGKNARKMWAKDGAGGERRENVAQSATINANFLRCT